MFFMHDRQLEDFLQRRTRNPDRPNRACTLDILLDGFRLLPNSAVRLLLANQLKLPVLIPGHVGKWER